ncbi:MAG TPA: exo-alpha-sialidase [Devosia sp.]|nr:exo-alpha-sialidase [Devosia sp.]
MAELSPERVTGLMDGVVRPVDGRIEAYLASPCVQNHAANLAFLPDGTLTCVWFGGTMEGMGDISIYLSRLAPGSDTWSTPEKLSDDAGKSEQNPLLFAAPDGKVWLLYTSQTAGNQDGSIVMARVSEDGGVSFGPVHVLCDLPGTFVRQPIVVNAAGQWLLPVFRCVGIPGQRWTGDADNAGVLVSNDAGAHWAMTDVPNSIGAVHMNIVKLGGSKMAAFYRHRFAEAVQRSVSVDDGQNWSAPEATAVPNNNSSVQAIHLRDGRIAMVYNHSDAAMSSDRRTSLYDEIEGEAEDVSAPVAPGRAAIWGVPRAPLSLTFSSDGGVSFGGRIDLETGSGYCLTNNSKDGLNREFSYPSIVEGPDGALHIAFTYFRRAIKYVRREPAPGV